MGAAFALISIAVALAAVDPDRAEHVARSAGGYGTRVNGLVEIAKVLAATDPDRAAQFLTGAEQIARSITDEYSKACALMNIAKALVALST